MVFSLLYRRPAKLSSEQTSLSSKAKQKSIDDSIASGCSCVKNGIPEGLSFERIVDGGTCPPCTTRDFMNYLKYVEYSAENLQFYLWYRSYQSRWSKLSHEDRLLSPEWTRLDSNRVPDLTPRKCSPITVSHQELDQGSPESNKSCWVGNEVSIITKKTWSDSSSGEGDDASVETSKHVASERPRFTRLDGNLVLLTTQPCRSEITRIITTYLIEGAPRELNLSGRERQAVLQALKTTTHPSAFSNVMTSIEYSLRKQAHPNFVRWTICNGNRPRVIFARILGLLGITVGLVADLLITLSGAARPYRIIPFASWFIGIATLFAAVKGMCVVLHGLHHRHLRPWELLEDEASDHDLPSWDSLTSTSTNSFEDESWVPRYEKRNLVRKIFDREVWIQEPALRQIQDTIFLQAILSSLALSCIVVGIFCAVPAGNFY